MKQLNLFGASAHEEVVVRKKQLPRKTDHWQLFVDGASRNNPGPSGAGLYIKKNGETFLQKGFFLGTKTNNQAEYLALLLGIFYLEPLVQVGDQVDIVADSELLVKQINGHYKVKNVLLRALHNLASIEVDRLGAKLSHCLRELNKEADKMANKGIDAKTKPPAQFLKKLADYVIAF